MALIIGLILGLVINIPVGPINVLIISTTLKKNLKYAYSLGLGAALMDFLYFFVILSGLRFVSFSQEFEYYFQLIGSILILLLGIKDLVQSSNFKDGSEVEIKKSGLVSYFTLGIFLYVSNPALVLTMSGLAVYIKSLTLVEESMFNISLMSLGLFLGSFVWFSTLGRVVNNNKKRMIKFYPYICKASGILLIGFGSFFLLKITEII